jgi:hypothetical protein
MMRRHVLLVAGPAERDRALVAAAAAHRPRRVTVLIEPRDRGADWSDRLAGLLTAVERATGASVVGLLGTSSAAPEEYDAVVRARPLLTAA